MRLFVYPIYCSRARRRHLTVYVCVCVCLASQYCRLERLVGLLLLLLLVVVVGQTRLLGVIIQPPSGPITLRAPGKYHCALFQEPLYMLTARIQNSIMLLVVTQLGMRKIKLTLRKRNVPSRRPQPRHCERLR